ncbi:unnamed protein product [Soboliphyme baturini]|uniref:Coiled-coil domain-containing protein 25 n=1 Tax=Soboliphyme baturini TaxID=241478 RepID=A0A183IF24_9BILA|nr:unnamed protein product [Soboliphyme baturini]
MVIFFESTVVSPPAKIYMGVDKYENEDLIRWGWPEDVWFHVDNVSSAHVYLRLAKGQTLDDIPTKLLQDCAQLVKANSIHGSKMSTVKVVYTAWSNLLKTASMDVGQVGFKNKADVRYMAIEKKDNDALKRLNKTKVEKNVDLRGERERRDAEERIEAKRLLKEQKQWKKEEAMKAEEEKRLRSFADLMTPEKMTSNKDAGYDSDEFM